MEQLSDDDLLWLAQRIHEHRETRSRHPAWSTRIDGAIDILIWSASVDGRDGEKVVKDGWVKSGQGLRDTHFRNVPHTEMARTAFESGALKEIKREHVVPRNEVLGIVLKTASVKDTKRVLKRYSLIALVHDSECPRLRPAKSMPKGWGANVNWVAPPRVLPDPWKRYRDAKPPVVPRHHDGRPAY